MTRVDLVSEGLWKITPMADQEGNLQRRIRQSIIRLNPEREIERVTD